ncbi:MAG: hypothetical protein WC764_02570 [Candidatus Paceibacterota bacterium]|jgi:NifB/MoaA-like Fe-S oxidoreductase
MGIEDSYDSNEEHSVEDLMENDSRKLEGMADDLENVVKTLEHLDRMGLNLSSVITELQSRPLAKINDALIGKTLQESKGNMEKLQDWVNHKETEVRQSEARVNDMPVIMEPGFNKESWLRNQRNFLERDKKRLKILVAALAKSKEGEV